MRRTIKVDRQMPSLAQRETPYAARPCQAVRLLSLLALDRCYSIVCQCMSVPAVITIVEPTGKHSGKPQLWPYVEGREI